MYEVFQTGFKNINDLARSYHTLTMSDGSTLSTRTEWGVASRGEGTAAKAAGKGKRKGPGKAAAPAADKGKGAAAAPAKAKAKGKAAAPMPPSPPPPPRAVPQEAENVTDAAINAAFEANNKLKIIDWLCSMGISIRYTTRKTIEKCKEELLAARKKASEEDASSDS